MDTLTDSLTIAIEGLRALAGPWPAIFAFDFGRYLIAATLVTVIALLLPHRVAVFRRTRRTLPRPKQRRFEFGHSVITAATFGVIGLVIYHGSKLGVFHVYPGSEQSWLSWAGSLVAIIIAHDAYFYWTHRWMHHPRLFRSMHRTHHRSVAPTVWTSYSFSIPEAIVQAGFVPLVLLVVPVSGSVLFAWMAHQILRNAAGHSGVELIPTSWLATWWGRWFTTTLHHDMHHQEGRGNYGLYFTWWDRWGGTEHPEYRARLARLVQALGEKTREPEASAAAATHPTRSNPPALPQTPP